MPGFILYSIYICYNYRVTIILIDYNAKNKDYNAAALAQTYEVIHAFPVFCISETNCDISL